MRCSLALALLIADARAEDTSSVSIEPLPRTSYLRFEPSYTFVADGGSAEELRVRGLLVRRWPEDRLWGVGVEVALHRESTHGLHATGLDDLKLTPMSGAMASWGVVGAGLAIALPAATDRAFGSGAFEIGPAWFVQSAAIPHLDLSLLARTYFAVAGSADRSSALATRLEPGVALSLPAGFVLSSSGEIEIEWLVSSATVPVNLQVAHALGDHVIVTLGPEVVVAGRDRGSVTLDLQIDVIDP